MECTFYISRARTRLNFQKSLLTYNTICFLLYQYIAIIDFYTFVVVYIDCYACAMYIVQCTVYIVHCTIDVSITMYHLIVIILDVSMSIYVYCVLCFMSMYVCVPIHCMGICVYVCMCVRVQCTYVSLYMHISEYVVIYTCLNYNMCFI